MKTYTKQDKRGKCWIVRCVICHRYVKYDDTFMLMSNRQVCFECGEKHFKLNNTKKYLSFKQRENEKTT